MLTQFYFENFEPNSNIREYAKQAIGRILNAAPFVANGVALVSKQETDYRCSLDIYSSKGPFIASAVGSSPKDAIHAIEQKLKKHLEKWEQSRIKNQLNFSESIT